MAFVKYTGRSHFRILDAEDLKALGVKGFRKTTWARGEALEVSDSIAEALIDNLADEFDIVDEAEPSDDDPNKVNWVERVDEGQTEAPAPVIS